MLELAGVSLERMPPILRPDEVAGAVTTASAAETGLLAGTPVVCGTGDWFCTVIGSGCYLPERVCFYLGTAGILGAFQSEAELDRLGATRYFGSVTATGSALRWARDLLFADASAKRLRATAPRRRSSGSATRQPAASRARGDCFSCRT